MDWEDAQKLKSWIKPRKFREFSTFYEYPDTDEIDEITNDIVVGCDIGNRGVSLCPSDSSNTPEAHAFGDRITDTIADGIRDGIIMGPMSRDQLPFKDMGVKVSGIMVKLKPTGVARMILNMSRGLPFGLNEGMSCKERFQVKMSSTRTWRNLLLSVGTGAWFCKIDWAQAYKHLRVQKSDVRQQFFKWCDKYFAELCLVFGASSSVGLYDRLAKVVLYMACRESGLNITQTQQIIDDAIACGTKEQCAAFYNAYRYIGESLGIKLAPEDKKMKAFSGTQSGEVFGIFYDTQRMTCWLHEEKMGIIISMLTQVIEMSEKDIAFWESLTGKLIHYVSLAPTGRFHIRSFMIMLRNTATMKKTTKLVISRWVHKDCIYWRKMLPFCQERTIIRDDRVSLPDSALQADTDASGASLLYPARGMGAILEEHMWVYTPHGESIARGALDQDEKLLHRKMTLWELVAPLMLIVSARKRIANRQLVIHVDNSGAVYSFRDGYSKTCDLSSTIILAIHEITASINCEIELRKVRRCSTQGACAADSLAKGDFIKFRHYKPLSNMNPEPINPILSTWINSPKIDHELGTRIMESLGIEYSHTGHPSAYL